MLYDSSYRRYLEESGSERQKVNWWLPGPGGGRKGEFLLKWHIFQLGR